MYIERSQQNWIGRGCFALSLALAIAGCYLAIKSPKLANTRDVQAVYQAARIGEPLNVEPDRGSFFLGLTLIAGAMGTAWVGAQTASPEPEAIAAPKTTTPAGEPVARPDLVADMRRSFGEVLSHDPWLMRFLPRGKQGSVAIMAGSSGAGKSAFSSAVAFLRALLQGHEVIILDPHAALNRQYQTWLTGTIYNASEIKSVLPKVLEPRKPEDKPLTIIVDEFSGWTKPNGLDAEAVCLVDHAIRNARKYGHHMLFCTHGLEKGLFAGEDLPSGMQNNVQTAAHICELFPGVDGWGDTVWTGKGRYKLAKLDPGIEGNWQPIQAPRLFNPETLRTQLKGVLEFLGLDPFYASDDKFRLPEEMQRNLDQAINATSPEFRAQLEALMGLELDTDHEAIKEGDRASDELPEKLQKIIELALSKGFIKARDVKRNFAIWKDADPAEIRAAFQHLADEGYGRLRGVGESLEFSARPEDS